MNSIIDYPDSIVAKIKEIHISEIEEIGDLGGFKTNPPEIVRIVEIWDGLDSLIEAILLQNYKTRIVASNSEALKAHVFEKKIDYEENESGGVRIQNCTVFLKSRAFFMKEIVLRKDFMNHFSRLEKENAAFKDLIFNEAKHENILLEQDSNFLLFPEIKVSKAEL